MLQQTQVRTVIPYEQFVARPVFSLAATRRLKLWEAWATAPTRNLHAAAGYSARVGTPHPGDPIFAALPAWEPFVRR
jgi:adenine-specific DNA glycosylase